MQTNSGVGARARARAAAKQPWRRTRRRSTSSGRPAPPRPTPRIPGGTRRTSWATQTMMRTPTSAIRSVRSCRTRAAWAPQRATRAPQPRQLLRVRPWKVPRVTVRQPTPTPTPTPTGPRRRGPRRRPRLRRRGRSSSWMHSSSSLSSIVPPQRTDQGVVHSAASVRLAPFSACSWTPVAVGRRGTRPTWRSCARPSRSSRPPRLRAWSACARTLTMAAPSARGATGSRSSVSSPCGRCSSSCCVQALRHGRLAVAACARPSVRGKAARCPLLHGAAGSWQLVRPSRH
mmetsp:Transcript_86595/g.273308  ORF Transcript_86595/g.273308 Transcript_86595/m.273308 type:complete len:288 (-) Transcript_86595:1234-2097(-)